MSGERARGRIPGGVIGLIGGAMTGLAYLALPTATVPFIGSLRAPELAGAVPGVTSLAFLPIVPVLALVNIGLGLWLILGKPSGRSQRIAAIGLIGSAALIGFAYLLPFARLQNELTGSGVSSYGITATTFTGGGFWLAVIGAVVTAAGAAVELSGARTRSDA